MYKNAVVAVIIPAYNEAAHLDRVIKTVPRFVDQIVIVDDCSTDETSTVASSSGDDRVFVVRHDENLGVGGAIISGHQHAVSQGADVDVVMAGDGQMDPAYLRDLLDPVLDDGFGYAKANRFYSVTSFEGMPRHRIVGNIVMSFLTKVASGYWHIFDPQNGYTAIRRDVLTRLPLDRLSRRYSFENDLLIQLNILRVPAIDVPVPALYGSEVSGIRLRRVVPEMLRLMFVGFWRRMFLKYVLWSFSPVALFLFVGLGLLSLGLVVGAWTIIQTIGPPSATAGSVLLAVVPSLVGIQMLMYALLLDIQQSPDSPMSSSVWRPVRRESVDAGDAPSETD